MGPGSRDKGVADNQYPGAAPFPIDLCLELKERPENRIGRGYGIRFLDRPDVPDDARPNHDAARREGVFKFEARHE